MHLALDLNLPADTRLLAATRKVLAVYLSAFGASESIVDDVILAMDEACTNVVQHAYPDGPHHDLTYLIRADIGHERVMIEVVDEGIGFDIMAKPPVHKDDGDLASGGRGMDVMRRLMTTVEVESPTASGGTRLRMVRLLPPQRE